MNIREQCLMHLFSPWAKICEVPLRQVQQALIFVFKIRGMPLWIKVDNGRPFGDPKLETIPPLALWLIALGIRVIWNRPKIPQDNAKVERSQGVMANWTECHKCQDSFHLQLRLWQEADFHNLHFPVRRLKGKTRIEAFPDLLQSKKTFQPQNFDLQRTLDFLSGGKWEREVSKVGQVSIFGGRLQAGMKYAYQRVSVKLNPQSNTWEVFDRSGNLLKSVKTGFTEIALWNLDLS